jgi:Uma2 family endonuclease
MDNIATTLPTFHVELPFDGDVQIVPSRKFTDATFKAFCQENPELRVELEPDGTLTIMPPTHFDSGHFELEIAGELRNYAKKQGTGLAFGSSAGFKLPDGSTRAADAAWVSNEQVARLTPKERKSFARVVPEFVVELRSDTDRLAHLKGKMTNAWIANGVRLAWLIDPVEQKAYIYRADGSIQVVTDFTSKLNGENVLPGFEFDLGLLK